MKSPVRSKADWMGPLRGALLADIKDDGGLDRTLRFASQPTMKNQGAALED